MTIPEGVVSLGQHAFALMNDLDKVYVPKSLVDIGLYAFGNDHPVTFYGPADSYTQQWVAMTKMRSAPDNERFEYVVMSKKDMRAHKKSLPPIRYAYEKGCKTIQQLVASGRSIEYVPESEPTDMHAQFLRPKGIDNPWLRLEFRYSTNEDGSIAINGYHYTSWYGAWLSDSGGMLTPYGDHVGYYSLEDTRQLDIPDTLNGHPVTEISYITTDHASILIPEGVTTIRRGIFQRGSPVIHVPASLTYIGPETGIDEEWDGMPMYFLGPDGSYTQQWLAALKQAEPKKYAKWRYLVDIRADLIAKGLTDDAISVYYYLLSHDTERLFSDFNFVATYVDDLKFWDVVFFASANWLEVIRSGAVSIGPALASADTGFIQLMADEFMNSEAKNKAILKTILDSMAGIEQDRLYSDMKLTTKKLKAAETLLEMVTGDDYWSTELLAVMTDPLQKTNKVMDTLLTDYQDSIDFLEALRGISGSNPKFQAAVNNMLVTYNMRFQNLYLNDKLDELFVKIVGKAVGSRPFGLVTTLLDMYQDSPAVKGLENVLAMNTIKHLALEEYRRLLGVIKSGQFEEKEIDHLLHVSDLCKGILLQEYKEMQKYYAIGSAQYKQLAKDILKIEQIMALDIMPIRMP